MEVPPADAAQEDEARDESGYRFAPTDQPDGESEADRVGTAGDVGAFGIWDLLRMLLVLLMVIGAVYGVISFLRRRVPDSTEDEESPIRVLATRSIGANKELYAVMIGSHVMILGGGDSSLDLLTTIEDQETIDELLLSASSKATRPVQRTFAAMLGRWLNNVTVPGSTAPDTTAAGGGEASQIRSFLHLQHERLRKMR